VDQVVGKGTSPLTSYFWPRNDAWEEMKTELESKSWIEEEEQVKSLIRPPKSSITGRKRVRGKSLNEAQSRFPEVTFSGSS
jgi:30S ribosomal protein 3